MKDNKRIAVDLSKQQALDTDPKAIQKKKKKSFTGNLDLAGNTTMFFIIEKVKETKKINAITIRLSSKMIGTNEINCSRKLLLTEK